MSSLPQNGILRHIEILQEKHGTLVPGVVSAPTDVRDYPNGDIPESDMPYVITLPDAASWRQESFNALDRQDRLYIVRVFMAQVGSGLSGEVLYDTAKMMQRFGNLYLGRNTQALQSPTTTKNQITLKASTDGIIDGGYEEQMIYGNSVYRGFEFQVGVYEKGGNDGTGY